MPLRRSRKTHTTMILPATPPARVLRLALALACALLLQLPAGAQRIGVSILGDSYSTFEDYVSPDTNELWYRWKPDPKRTDVSSPRQMWWWQLVERNGLRLETNNSYSGATVSYRGYRGEDYRARSFITRAPALGSPDLILVFGATNDDWAHVPLGQYPWDSGLAPQDSLCPSSYALPDSALYTFRPALVRLIDELNLRYPTVDIRFIVNSILRDDVKESVHEICRRLHVGCIDLHDLDLRAGHPTVRGQRQIREQVEAALFPGRDTSAPRPLTPTTPAAK